MGRIFDMDGKVAAFLNRIADLVVLNLLWIICSIPFITIGAATTALYYVSFKMVKNEESYIVRNFLRSFKENLRQSTVIWGILLLLSAVIYFDLYYSSHAPSEGARILTIPLLAAGFLLLATSCYVFAIQAYFKNSVKKTIKNASIMSIAHLPYTILIACFSFGPMIIVLLSGSVFAAALFFDLVCGVSLFAWINVHIFTHLFQRYIPADDRKETRSN